MSNKVDFGTLRQRTGWIAWYRLYHHGENRVLRNGKDDILFGSEAEAEAAAKAKFLEEMNTPVVAESFTGPTTKAQLARAQLEKLFQGDVEVTDKERREVRV